jgi:hypothetical protein
MGLPLLITVTPRPGESLNSLVARAAHKNVEENIGRFLALVDVNTRKHQFISFSKYEMSDAFAELLSVDPPIMRSLFHAPIDRHARDLVDWYGTPIPRLYIEAMVRRYSPTSLRKSAYHRAAWMIRPLQFCPESLELLSSTCPSCGAESGWEKTRGIANCEKCGHALKDHCVELIPENVRAQACLLSNFISWSPEKRKEALDLLPLPFRDWEGGDAFVATVELASIAKSVAMRRKVVLASGKTANLSALTTSELVRGYELLRGWPNSFEALIAELVDNNRLEREAVLVFFEIALRQGAFTEFREYLRSKLPEFLLTHGIPWKLNGNARTSLPSMKKIVTSTEATKKCSISSRMLSRLQKGANSLRANGRTKHSARLFDEDQLVRSRAIMREAASIGECSRILGALPHCVSVLAERGVIEKITDTDALMMSGTPLFDRQSILHLDGRLRKTSVSLCESKRLVDVFRGRFHPEDCADIIEEILTGSVRVGIREPRQSSVLCRLGVDVEHLTEFSKDPSARELPSGILVSCFSAGRMVGLSAVAVGVACRLRFIRGANVSCQKPGVPIKELAEFDRRFVVGVEVAAMLGVSGMALAKRMQAEGYKPVAKLQNNLVWNRSDVDKYLENEAAQNQLRERSRVRSIASRALA